VPKLWPNGNTVQEFAERREPAHRLAGPRPVLGRAVRILSTMRRGVTIAQRGDLAAGTQAKPGPGADDPAPGPADPGVSPAGDCDVGIAHEAGSPVPAPERLRRVGPEKGPDEVSPFSHAGCLNELNSTPQGLRDESVSVHGARVTTVQPGLGIGKATLEPSCRPEHRAMPPASIHFSHRS
jgi:hypothetical protein